MDRSPQGLPGVPQEHLCFPSRGLTSNHSTKEAAAAPSSQGPYRRGEIFNPQPHSFGGRGHGSRQGPACSLAWNWNNLEAPTGPSSSHQFCIFLKMYF